MIDIRKASIMAALSFALIAWSGCSGPGSSQHVSPTSDSHARQAQFVQQGLPFCDPDLGCWVVPCDICNAAVPLLYDAYYLVGGGGGGGGAPPPVPPPLGGTADGCDADESLCYLIPGDDVNVINYSTGQGGVYTVDASACQPVGNGFVSTTDGKSCSTWQVFFYTGQYVGQTPNPQPPSLPGVVDGISIQISTANSNYPVTGNGQVLNGGHLYIAFWSNHLPLYPAVQLLQAGVGSGRIRYAPFKQNVLGDPRFYFPLLRTQALTLSQTLVSNKNTYASNTVGDAAPVYIPPLQNSNTWADALLLSSGMSQLTIGLYAEALAIASANTRYPYAYQTGYALLGYFQ